MAIAPDKLPLWVKTTERLGLKALFAKDFPDYEGHWLKLIIESLLNDQIRVSASKMLVLLM